MGFTEILTIIFVVLKLIGIISWSWWLVFMPEIIAVVLYILFLIGVCKASSKSRKSFKKMWEDDKEW
jgi:ABC-type bacteriocin/lantibiotic exporter with double-glycine peptidase domain